MKLGGCQSPGRYDKRLVNDALTGKNHLMFFCRLDEAQVLFMRKRSSDNYKFLIILAVQQAYIDKKTFDRCARIAREAEDKPRAIVEFLNRGFLNKVQFNRLLELYQIFLTRQDKIRFGELAIALKYLSPGAVETALEKQKELQEKTGQRKKIGDILVAWKKISPKQRNLILLKQQRDLSVKPSKLSVPMREIHGQGVVLLLQEDGLKAFVKKKGPDLPDAGSVVDFMSDNGVTYGIVSRYKMAQFLESTEKRLFLVAHGTPVKESRDAFVEYLFAESFLTSGSRRDDGTMDFRDRGMLPMVGPGDVLARKHPPVEGEAGVNIFGEPIHPCPVRDLDLKAGEGTALSEDGMAVHAADKGFPKKDMAGCVSVVQQYHIQGDVGYGTGHIEFEGDVVVTGTVKPGFRVQCRALTADAVEGGFITCAGDVFVRNGILESTIHSRGNVAAVFVTRSDISCLGDMIVAREVLDSMVVINGSCRMETGRILSSDVTAKQGVWVKTVGSKGARNSVLTAGVSKYAEREMNRVEGLAKLNQETLDLRITDKESVEAAEQDFAAWQSEMAAVRARLEKNIRSLEGEGLLTPAKAALVETCKRQLKAIIRQIHDGQADARRLNRLTEDLDGEVAAISKENNTLIHEMLSLKKMVNQNPSSPVIRISGKVESGTKLCGCHAHTVVKESVSHVRVSEVRQEAAFNSENWVLTLAPG